MSLEHILPSWKSGFEGYCASKNSIRLEEKDKKGFENT